jgi:proline iminopeptidase
VGKKITEGYIPFKGYQTWYRIVGDGDEAGKLPLLCLHGGPGATHDYLESLDAMADTGRRVIYYDQLGCGTCAPIGSIVGRDVGNGVHVYPT